MDSICCFIDIELEIEEYEEIEFELEDIVIVRGGGVLPYYTGDYNPIPKRTPQTLFTKEKSMLDDVNIQGIPYTEITNPQGGKTVNIAYVL